MPIKPWPPAFWDPQIIHPSPWRPHFGPAFYPSVHPHACIPAGSILPLPRLPDASHQLLPNAMHFTPNGPTARKIHNGLRYTMHFSAIVRNYNGMTAYICRRLIPTTAFLAISCTGLEICGLGLELGRRRTVWTRLSLSSCNVQCSISTGKTIDYAGGGGGI